MAEKPETQTQVVETVTEVVQKKFEIPSIDEVVLSIKELDEEIEHISLNLIKANFNATEDDVRKAFPEYKEKFLKVKQYKPGSFEVVFASRMDAIEFVRGAPGKKILGRIFLIKLGRNFKNNKEDWVYVEAGNDKKSYHNKNRNFLNRHQKPKQEEGKQTQQTSDIKQHHEKKQGQEKHTERRNIDIKGFEKPKYDKPREQRKEPRQFKHPQVKQSTDYVPRGFHSGTQPTQQTTKVQESKTVVQQEKIAKTTKPKVVKQAAKKQEKKQSEPEDDGWVTVKKRR